MAYQKLMHLFDFQWDKDLPYPNLTGKQLQILKAALEVFTEKGFSAATTAEIAVRAGVAEGTIFRHFKKKKDILLALLIPLLHNFVGPTAANTLAALIFENQDLPLKDLLSLILYDRYQLFTKNQALIRLVITESQYHPEIKEVFVKEVAYKSLETFIRLIKQRQETGELRSDISAWTLMRSLMGMMVLCLSSRIMFAEKEENKDIKVEISEIVNIFLSGSLAT